MKKFIALLLALAMVFALAACGSKTAESPAESKAPAESGTPALDASSIKIGVVMIGDESDKGYNYNHVLGIKEMQKALGISDEQIIYKANVPEGSECEAAIRELCEAGCNIIFANSFGFETYMVEVAPDYPDIQFCHATGYLSASDDLENTHNYFAAIHEARYLAGIAAGMKTQNNHLGYVAAKPFAEVISGFTAFYLGAKSVNPDVTMDVIYTNEWSDATKEAQAAQALIDKGCDVISQHSDTTAPATTAQTAGVWQVGYNADMTEAAPEASLISARINWGVYYTYAVKTLLEGGKIDQDWCKGLADGAVSLTPLNTKIAAEGTQEAIDKASAEIVAGTRHVFAGPLKGKGTDATGAEKSIDIPEGDYFREGEASSAPAWYYIIDGINVIR
ncbi:MAG: BMP family ABC transporter substrate-binding protein [Clostridiales bacterium]|nr:BMP family ABC transporter substrate-binding protein [Clostridiales bacterium]